MMIEQVSSDKEILEWQKVYIQNFWHFREFVKLETEANKAKNYGMRRHWWDKRCHIGKKIEDHMENMPKEIQVKEFTRVILEKINQGKHPNQILKELEERAKKI